MLLGVAWSGENGVTVRVLGHWGGWREASGKMLTEESFLDICEHGVSVSR